MTEKTNKSFVTYDDLQEALRLTAEAERKRDVSSGPELTAKSASTHLVEALAKNVGQVRIQERRPFRGQVYADMALTHVEHGADLLHRAMTASNAKDRLDALRLADEHLHEAKRLAMLAGSKVQEELMKRPGEEVRLSDDFGTPTKHPKF